MLEEKPQYERKHIVTVQLSEPKEGPMKNTPLGLASCFVAALVWMGSCGGVVAIGTNQLYFFKDPSGMRAMEFGFLISLGMALLGVGLAIGGLMQADRKKLSAVLGLILNGLVLLAGLGVFCLSQG